ncbi:PE family protein [Mycobacterium kansasii 662]|uniref:PE family protein n=3 Tax=Mycobacterium kansasii TaxID=1768 RepID=A0A1V3WMH2_MYCKA|nr:cell motility protein [Mycobacterium kansasii ATCC 12478]EUA00425.1 PE family protein [Mycobacterium kansasii 824]EUA18732.1 PE family protein [Mycobacterium kansasii 662]OOK68174.1 PE family protein [Mycobacterium kansasii]OOK71896.1 PE family protein [Mycobacterium kansasii]
MAVTLWVVPEGLAGAAAAVEALSARLAAAHAAAAPMISAVVAPAADPVSLSTAAGFSAGGIEHVGVATEAVEELTRSGAGLGTAGISYAAGDSAAALTYGLAGAEA